MQSSDAYAGRKERFSLVFRLIRWTFAFSAALFCLIVLWIPSMNAAAQFSVSTEDASGIMRLLPLSGVLCIAASLLVERRIVRTRWFSSTIGTDRFRACFLVELLRLTLLEASVIPGLFYFILTGSTEWVLGLGFAGIMLMLFSAVDRELP